LNKLVLFLVAVLVFSSFASAQFFAAMKTNLSGAADTSSRIAKLEQKVSMLEAQNRMLIALVSRQAAMIAKLSAQQEGMSPSEAESYAAEMDKTADAASDLASELFDRGMLGSVFGDIARGVDAMLAGATMGSNEGKEAAEAVGKALKDAMEEAGGEEAVFGSSDKKDEKKEKNQKQTEENKKAGGQKRRRGKIRDSW